MRSPVGINSVTNVNKKKLTDQQFTKQPIVVPNSVDSIGMCSIIEEFTQMVVIRTNGTRSRRTARMTRKFKPISVLHEINKVLIQN